MIKRMYLMVAAALAAQGVCGVTAENGITAHRGDSLRLPQNSLRAFSSANRIGADWIETDVHLTKDGQLVISHNATTGEYCSQNKVIKECTYAELAQLDMAEKFRAQHKLTLEQCPKVTIVRLEEALDLILAEKKARLSIQPKCDCVDQAMALVRQKGALKWVGFNDGNAKWMSRVKELEPSVPVFWDRGRNMDVDKDIAFAKEHGFETLVLFHPEVTPERVQKLKAAGFKVGAWTVNAPAEMRRFLDMGLDRLYTDDPATFKKIKAEKSAKIFVENLRRIADSRRFVYSWTHPWLETDPAFRAADGDGWRAKEPGEFKFSSRFNDLTGEEPVMYFTDLRFVAGTYLGEAQYAKNRASLKAMIRKAWHDYHAVPVFSWHVENPYVPNGWKDPKHGEATYRYRYSSKDYPQENRYVIRQILEGTGGPCGFGRCSSYDASAPVATNANPRAWYDARLAEIASFLLELKGTDGKRIPAVVRLFHECEDDWQWWGLGSVSVKDYVELFRYTATRLRELAGGDNLLFAYSPDRYWWRMGAEGDGDAHSFMGRYPGDGFVDIIGYDDYQIGTGTNMQVTVKRQESAVEKMRQITAEARRRGKVCGLLESGAIGAALPDYYDWLYKAVTADGVGFSFVNMWGGYEIPRSPEGKECLKRFLAKPEVVTFRDGINLASPVKPGEAPVKK